MKVLPAHSDPVTAVSFNHDGTLIVSCAMDGLMYDTDLVTNDSASTDNNTIDGSGTQTRVNVLKLWSTMTTQSGMLSIHPFFSSSLISSLYSSHVTFSPNSKFVLASTQDSTIRLWNYQTSRCVKTYSGHTNRTYCLFASFLTSSSGRKFVVAGSEDAKVYIWDLQTREVLQTLDGHRGGSRYLVDITLLSLQSRRRSCCRGKQSELC